MLEDRDQGPGFQASRAAWDADRLALKKFAWLRSANPGLQKPGVRAGREAFRAS